jgi:PAS domain-containing protein
MMASPTALVVALTFVVLVLTLYAAIALVRRARRQLMAEVLMSESEASESQSPMHAYNAVIQQLKQQKHELLTLQQTERRQAKTTENISAAVLSHLSSGVLFLTPNGLVRRTNAAARSILGYASPSGLNTAELFRDATVISPGSHQDLAVVVQSAVREQRDSEKLTARYITPEGETKILEITITCVRAHSGEVLGAACLINDQTQVERLQRREELRGELSSEMALALRTSLAAISGYATQLSASPDPDRVRQLASDIVSEAAELDRTIGGFLVGAKAAGTAAGA